MSEEEKQIFGKIESKEEKQGGEGDKAWTRVTFKIKGQTFSIFKNVDNKEMVDSFNTGDSVEVVYTETKAGKYIYKNIKEIKPSEEKIPEKSIDVDKKEVISTLFERKFSGKVKKYIVAIEELN